MSEEQKNSGAMSPNSESISAPLIFDEENETTQDVLDQSERRKVEAILNPDLVVSNFLGDQPKVMKL